MNGEARTLRAQTGARTLLTASDHRLVGKLLSAAACAHAPRTPKNAARRHSTRPTAAEARSTNRPSGSDSKPSPVQL